MFIPGHNYFGDPKDCPACVEEAADIEAQRRQFRANREARAAKVAVRDMQEDVYEDAEED